MEGKWRKQDAYRGLEGNVSGGVGGSETGSSGLPARRRTPPPTPPPAEPSARNAARQLGLHQTLVSPSPPFTEGSAQERQQAANAARKKAKRQEGRLAPTLGTPRRGGNDRIEVGRAARDARRGLKIRPSSELLRLIPIGATHQACGRGALWSALASCCIGIRLFQCG